ncbi:MAG: cell surface protein SprA, partial [Cyclobacteriaceae bacterium]
MSKLRFYIAFFTIAPLLTSVFLTNAKNTERLRRDYHIILQDTIPADTLRKDSIDSVNQLPYTPSKQPTFTPTDRFGDPFSNRTSKSPLVLQDPASLKLDVEIDTSLNYTIYEKIGDINFRPTTSMSFEEFNDYQTKQLIRNYWKDRSVGLDGESAVSGRRLIPRIPINPGLDRIFGGDYVDIQPNGFVNLDIGGRWQRSEDPSVPVRRQRTGNLQFDQQINMNVVGRIGEKLAVTASFDNKNTFDFQNDLKVEYTGYDEDIIKKIEIGNVSMPVTNSLMSGAQNLFGIKTQLQFGKLFLTGVASRQQSTNKELIVPLCNDGFGSGTSNSNSFNAGDGSAAQGAGQNSLQIYAPDYADNQHFFLGHFFRDNYERWLKNYPNVNNNSLLIDPGRVEVYISVQNSNDTRNLREIVALTDLGEFRVRNNESVSESDPTLSLLSLYGDTVRVPTTNRANGLYSYVTDDNREDQFRNNINAASSLRALGLVEGEDFTIVQARKLNPDEYFINPKTGFLSLRRRVSDQETIGISYQYSYGGENFQVGEVAQNYQQRSDDELIYLKMIKPNAVLINNSTWDLMMKNIYDLQNGSGIRDVSMQINYLDFSSGLPNPSLPLGANTQGVNLNQVLGVDRLNQNFDPQPDGKFDDIPQITLYEGKLVFPILEPFGQNLSDVFASGEEELAERFVFDDIYDDTKINAHRNNEKTNFIMDVSFEGGNGNGGSSANGKRVNNVIQLPFNVDANSITVTIAGRILRAGQDYTISGIGTLTINDQIASSCLEVRIQFEESDLFNFQTKWFTGLRAEYIVNENFNFGATLLRLNERPGGISRFSIGNEPLRNTKWGLDVNYSSESRFLTKLVDALPILNTKEPSRVDFSAEFAQLLPGTSNIVGGEGTSYLDDFENSITPIPLGNFQGWKLGATPLTNNNKFFDGLAGNSLEVNYKRAKIAWYTVDNTIFYASNSQFFPENLTLEEIRGNYYERPYLPQELFPGRDRFVLQVNEPLFDIAYFPSERGQNNYSTDLTQDGLLNNPESNFGAITRANTVLTNYVQQNIEYIEFWLLDPFIDGPEGVVKDGVFNTNNTTGGEMVINIGDVSEDVLRDDRFAFEHGLPEDGSDEGTNENIWGRVTTESYLTDFYPNNLEDSRVNQDVGLDGLDDEREATFNSFNPFTQSLSNLPASTRDEILQDVSADNFQYYLGEDLDNADASIVRRYKNFNGLDGNNSVTQTTDGLTPSYSNTPDKEDLNLDNTLSSIENYFEYRVPLLPDNSGELISDFIVDRVDVGTEEGTASWYLFRIPINDPDRKVGNPDLQTIKYTRLYLTGWKQPVVLRMAKFQMVGSKWLRVSEPLNEPGFNEIPDPAVTDFNVTVVNIEENAQAVGDKSPYVLPPGLTRDQDNTTTNVRRRNEQSIQICIDDLQDQDSRAIFKQTSFDLVNYGTIRMFLHAESNDGSTINDDELTAFLRLGNSETQNYYEIEVPLKITRPPFAALDGDENEALRRQVWPEENEINLAMQELYTLKSQRNRLGASPLSPFSRRSEDGKYNITVVGDPKLSIVRTLVIGVRNPRSDDRAAKSVCLWANELRVTDFDNTNGWAGRARLNTKLADFATVSASTSY